MKFFYLAVISIFLAGCSTNSTIETTANSNASTGSINSNAVNSNQTNAEMRTESNAPPENVKIRSAAVINRENIEAMKQRKTGDANVAPIESVPSKIIAPDESEISATMNAQGIPVQTRIFKNNPLLVKTEKIVADPKNPQIKVYLKSGKVISFPASKIGDLATVPANDILAAAGALPKTAPSDVTSKEQSKKNEN